MNNKPPSAAQAGKLTKETIAQTIDRIVNDVRDALYAWYKRDGELNVRFDVDGFRDELTISVNENEDDDQ